MVNNRRRISYDQAVVQLSQTLNLQFKNNVFVSALCPGGCGGGTRDRLTLKKGSNGDAWFICNAGCKQSEIWKGLHAQIRFTQKTHQITHTRPKQTTQINQVCNEEYRIHHAQTIYERAGPLSSNHPYLLNKQLRLKLDHAFRQIDAYRTGLHGLTGQCIVVPGYRNEKLSCIELIDERGVKRSRGVKTGAYCRYGIPMPEGYIFIGEGMATVAFAANAFGDCGYIAFGVNNFKNVIPKVLQRHQGPHPNTSLATIVILIDQDNGHPNPIALQCAQLFHLKHWSPSYGN